MEKWVVDSVAVLLVGLASFCTGSGGQFLQPVQRRGGPILVPSPSGRDL